MSKKDTVKKAAIEGKEQVKAIGSKAKTLFTEKPQQITERVKTKNKGK